MRTILILSTLLAVALADSVGVTTRYWDCCKPSCAWNGKSNKLKKGPMQSCDKNNNPLKDVNVQSGCVGGGAYSCSTEMPWAINDTVSYGFAAVKLVGNGEGDWCCACYELTFTNGPVKGKKFVIQATNTGDDVSDNLNHFDLGIPGGGVGYYTQGCQTQWGAPANGWGQRYGGVSSRAECNQLPAALRPGCQWRFDWAKGADNPNVTFKRVKCPVEITNKSKCIRSDE